MTAADRVDHARCVEDYRGEWFIPNGFMQTCPDQENALHGVRARERAAFAALLAAEGDEL